MTDAGIVYWFQFSSNTSFVYNNSESDTFDAYPDKIIKLSGLAELSASAFGAAEGNFN